MTTDHVFMAQALGLAKEAAANGEVPVGAVLVRDGLVIGEGANAQISLSDPTAHAEVLALRAAAGRIGNYRLPGTTLYVTLEPCTMCCGALVHARVQRLVFATREPRSGGVISAASCLENTGLNHHVIWHEGVLAEDSAQLLREFFRARR